MPGKILHVVKWSHGYSFFIGTGYSAHRLDHEWLAVFNVTNMQGNWVERHREKGLSHIQTMRKLMEFAGVGFNDLEDMQFHEDFKRREPNNPPYHERDILK